MNATHSIPSAACLFLSILLCLGLGLAPLAATAADSPVTNAPVVINSFTTTTNSPKSLSLESFKLIHERNIFNPNRTARSSRGGGGDTEKPKAPKVDHATLVGIMSYAKGDFAFFDGSDTNYRKTLQKDEKIAGHRIVEVAPKKVTLSMDGKNVTLSVGTQIKRVEEGPWEVAKGSDKATSTSSTGSSASDSSSDSGSGSGEDEILKRLLQKREQESKK